MRIIFFATLFLSLQLQAVVNGTPILTLPPSVQEPIREKTVRLIYYNAELREYRTFCSGYLSASNQVISAGHCVAGDSGRTIFAEVYNSKTKTYDRIQVSSQQYRSIENGADIARFTLAQDVDFEAGVNQSLPMVSESECDPGRPFLSSGFGKNNQGNAGTFNIAQYEMGSALATENTGVITPAPYDTFRLRSLGRQRVCAGDSGGPVFCFSNAKLSLVGVNQSIDVGAYSIRDGEYDIVRLCQIYESLTVSRISQVSLLNQPDPRELQMPTTNHENSLQNVAPSNAQ